ncbi:HTH-type transcriptional activator RhaS [Mycobacterium innocens]|uniref:HTH-type transcriptional activator RhaS n=1 Tax=Mycobacterium innocens TaxID=2341083 RepID=A0A498QAN9_9MYCO|nr:HTH-type transcriptional activator RhaS [Mycobacterium innocens]
MSTPAEVQRLRDLKLLRRARDRIDREYAQPLNVDALARSVNMSAGHFSRQFKLTYGESPYSYLMTRRIERAMALLRRGDLSVTEVCFTVGCSSLGTFSTRFTRTGRHATQPLSRAHIRRRKGHSGVPGEAGDPTDQESRSLGYRAAPSVSVMDITIHSSSFRDPEESLVFDRDMLGFEVRLDVGKGKVRWDTVGPPHRPDTSIVLYPAECHPRHHRRGAPHHCRDDGQRQLRHPALGNQRSRCHL